MIIKQIETPSFDLDDISLGCLVKFNNVDFNNTTGVVIGFTSLVEGYGHSITIETINPKDGKRYNVVITAQELDNNTAQFMLISRSYFSPKEKAQEIINGGTSTPEGFEAPILGIGTENDDVTDTEIDINSITD